MAGRRHAAVQLEKDQTQLNALFILPRAPPCPAAGVELFLLRTQARGARVQGWPAGTLVWACAQLCGSSEDEEMFLEGAVSHSTVQKGREACPVPAPATPWAQLGTYRILSPPAIIQGKDGKRLLQDDARGLEANSPNRAKKTRGLEHTPHTSC